ncbi:sugar MFS transporter [Dinghuibacter silviterrae]|uniref:Glucose/galactose transporter n=1 Tax=Dinghuibacter silviterrae TaxID=1539049 RepID=A0A4R8DF25_9BACT|nr:sugar MFS transporter [Dinghuibacter silviterrae]TDW95888.1 glucose/galactose transporter [Dinghuibacter silviterrae]
MQSQRNRSILILGLLFFIFGFITWLGSVLIPYLRIACQLNNFASYLVAFSFYIAYMLMALPAAGVLRMTGYRRGMALGLLIMAVGSCLFIPAAFLRSYPLFLTGLFIQGSGLALLQTASNPYVAIIGPLETAARRIGIMGVCNGIAGVVAPLILGAVVLKDADSLKVAIARSSPAVRTQLLQHLANRVVMPYGLILLALLAISLLVYFSRLPEPGVGPSDEPAEGVISERASIFQYPYLLLGAFTLFLYVGVEVISGDTIISYGSSQGIPLASARFFTSATLSCMLLGYLLGIVLIPKYLSQTSVLKFSGLLGIALVCLALSTRGYLSVAFIALLGLANAMVWPSIWPLAIRGLGKFTPLGASLLIVAVGGGAFLPLAYGRLADVVSPHLAYLLLLPCYACIWYYATAGHKIGLAI